MSPILIALTALVAAGIGAAVAARLTAQVATRRAQQVTTELTHLNELGRRLLRTRLALDDLCEMVYWQVRQIIPAGLFQLGLFEGDAYHVKVWVQDSEQLPQQVFTEGAHKGIVGWVRESGQPLLVSDFEAEHDRLPAFPEFKLDDPPRSGVFVPLIAGASTIGVMAIQSRQVGRFTEEHLHLLSALANQAAWAIRNAQLYERAHQRAERLNLIAQVVSQISAIQPLPALFQQIVDLVKDSFGYYCITIFVNVDDQILRMGASTDSTFAAQITDVAIGLGMIGWAAREGQTALANQVVADPRYRKLEILPETKSEIALPLKVEERVVGVLDVQSDRENAFSSEDVFVLETLATQIALAIEQAQTYDAEHRLAQRLEALMQVTQAVVSILDLDDLLDRVVDLIADTFEYERVHIFLRVGRWLVFRAGAGSHTVRWLIEEQKFDINAQHLIPQTARSGEAVIIRDLHQLEDFHPLKGVEDSRSEMVIPIKMVNRVMGVLDVQSDRVGAFGEDDLRLLHSLADAVAVAIRNAVLYVNERRRRNLAETLRTISLTVASNLDLDQVLAGILEGLERVISLETAAILLFDERQDVLHIAAATGGDLKTLINHEIALDSAAWKNENALEEAVHEAYHRLLALPDDHTCLTAPLVGGSTLIGYLLVDHHSPGQYSHHDQEIVLAFASQVAVAINNARLYSAQQAEAWVTTALLQVAEAVNAQGDVTESLETVARLTTLLVGVNQCLILRWQPTEGAFIPGAQQGILREAYQSLTAHPLPAVEHPFLDLLTVAEGAVGAGQGYQLPIPAPLRELLVSSIVGIPLRAKQELVGLLIVDDPGAGAGHDLRLMNILTGIAHQAATALESASLQASARERERLEQELEVARRIQATFIPETPPNPSGWQIAATWRAARQVSGDFYDFIPLSDGRWGLVIADVADKGVPAALFMAMSRTLLRAAAISRISPAETLMRVNELLHNDSRSDLFVTVFYAVWTPETGELIYASGGHNPPLLITHPDGLRRKPAVRELRSKGMALGILPSIHVEEQTIRLALGDVLVVYTDGITEAMQADYTIWGTKRLISTLCKLHRRPAKDIMAGILAAIDRFVGEAPQSDDLTFWLLQRQPTFRQTKKAK